MNPELISRVIGLVSQGNEKVILADPASGRAVVIMDLLAYEKMAVPAKPEEGAVSEPVRKPESPAEKLLLADLPEAPARPAEPEGEKAAVKTEEPPAQPVPDSPARPENRPESQVFRSPYPPIVKPKDNLAAPAFADLTQSELLDKINRDIASWKVAQDRQQREMELAAAAKEAVSANRQPDAMEEEERFYLEPVE